MVAICSTLAKSIAPEYRLNEPEPSPGPVIIPFYWVPSLPFSKNFSDFLGVLLATRSV